MYVSCVVLSSCVLVSFSSVLFFFNDPATTEIYTLSLHDALPISVFGAGRGGGASLRADRSSASRATMASTAIGSSACGRSEEHTSELQSPYDLVCRLLLEKKKKHLA